ncbi:NADPH:quinone oxidoreductase family protein [Ktedonosporobacter rubrisoli]|uniref:NADPH:quinone oxidoreductase family protein n=1 Tax=Ktedonosporobacter rubrisoli TaxID=2509675 RepID=A0A4P6JI82_KTERU|nr:NADPH:quinone oxidoreductase family protein [Ktedonosporobacter rubrisoli]QBD74767.1 NADPH:quinone oxidoreductase family protein [Ktedonosporobacter rubrisoli]
MRALLCKAYGEPSQLALEELSSAKLGPQEVRIAVHGIGVNGADALQVSGQFQLPAPFPFSPGFELSGVVVECGAEVKTFQVGDRVLAVTCYGAYAEEIVLPAINVAHLPQSMSMLTAAAFPVAYLTAYLSLKRRGHLQMGETLAVHGATGSVGRAALEVGRKLGATVIAVTGHPELLEGQADVSINYRQEAVAQRLLELTKGQGVNVILDLVGGELFEAAWSALAWEGRLLTVGFASGQIPQVNLAQILTKNASIVGEDLAAYITRDIATTHQALSELLNWYEQGSLRPHSPQIFPFEEGGEILQRVVTNQIRDKVVLATSYAQGH